MKTGTKIEYYLIADSRFDADILSKLNIKKANTFFEIVIFDFIQLILVE